ncbi:MAG: hypothetical protein EBT74_06990, partial [Gammaproteobacteria bacterium]|nr:hypothetical protein [Gammaproteobacteria bacterium]
PLTEDFDPAQSADPYWVHLDATSPDTNHFLKHSMALPTHVVDGLLADESRPRCDVFDNGILIILRGVNLNPGANPEDMVSLRIWLEENRVITTRFRRIMAVEDIVHQLQEGVGPTSTGHLVARLGARLTERMTPLISQLEASVGFSTDSPAHHRAETFPVPAAHGTGDAVQRKCRYALDEPVCYRSIS